MATVAKSGTPSPVTPAIPASNRISGLQAGEALAAGDACYIKSDNKVWKSTGTAIAAAAKVRGYAPTACGVGEAVTLIHGVEWGYGSGMTPGTDLFLSATAGLLDDAATTGGTAPVGFVIDANRVFLGRSGY